MVVDVSKGLNGCLKGTTFLKLGNKLSGKQGFPVLKSPSPSPGGLNRSLTATSLFTVFLFHNGRSHVKVFKLLQPFCSVSRLA